MRASYLPKVRYCSKASAQKDFESGPGKNMAGSGRTKWQNPQDAGQVLPGAGAWDLKIREA